MADIQPGRVFAPFYLFLAPGEVLVKLPLSSYLRSVLLLVGLTFGISIGTSSTAIAAERLKVSLGPINSTVAVEDLRHYAETGQVPDSLRLYQAFLTSDVQVALNSHLQLDPDVSDKLIHELLETSAGERMITALQMLIADSTAEDIQTTFSQAVKEDGGLSLLNFLQAYPKETITIDAASAVAIASQMNLPYWQSQAFSSVLDRELTVEPTTPINAELDPTLIGDQWVRRRTITLRDYDRKRTIPVDLYWSRHTTGPLVVMSHGFGADRRFLSYMAYHLASYGFTVAALEHPGSNVAWLADITMGAAQTGILGDILPSTEFIDRPKDVSFMLDQLEKINRYSITLQGKLNTDNVTVIGHSLGGYTAFALAGAKLNPATLRQSCAEIGTAGLSPADWLQCTAAELPNGTLDLKDPRVKQIIAFNPVIGRMFDEKSLSEIRVPTLVLAGTNDSIIPAVSQQLLPFTHIQSTKYLVTAIGGTHLSIGDPANLNQALTESLFVRELGGDDTENLRRLMKGVTLAFLKQQTIEARKYTPFLTPAYAQSFSSEQLKLRLNSEIPPNLTNWLKMGAVPLERFVAGTLSRQRHHQLVQQTGFSIASLLSCFPLVMFILPGNLPLVGSRLLKLSRKAKKQESDRDEL